MNNIIEAQLKNKQENSSVEEERTTLETFAEQLETLGQNYEQLTSREKEMLERISTSSAKLAGMFMDAMSSVQFQDITRQQIEQIIAGIERIDAHTLGIAGALERAESHEEANPFIKPLKDDFDALYANYVMDAQRDVHEQTLGVTAKASKASSSKKVELF